MEGVFAFKMMDVVMVFALGEKGEPIPLTILNEPVDLDREVPSIGFDGLEHWGSGRGYIWSRSLPIALSRPVIGTGPDTYALVFPQDDVVGKLKFMANPYIVVDKPHNMYLQMAINTGILSLLAYLAIFTIYLKDALPQAAKGIAPGEEPWAHALRLGILVGMFGYMASALSTDSTVSVSPVFWVVLGLGFALSIRAKGLRTGGGLL
jgi:O-antigen ligase